MPDDFPPEPGNEPADEAFDSLTEPSPVAGTGTPGGDR